MTRRVAACGAVPMPRRFAWRLLPHACVLLGLVAALEASPAATQTVWRCGPEGRTVYSDRPCTDPSGAVPKHYADNPTTADRQAAHSVAAREQRLAGQLVHEREAREAAAHAQSFGGIRSEAVLAANANGPAKPATQGQKPKTPKPKNTKAAKTPKAKKAAKEAQPARTPKVPKPKRAA